MEDMTTAVDFSTIENLISSNGRLLSAINTSIADTNNLLVQNNQLLAQLYASVLFIIGVAGASLVVFLLYKFLRKFF